MNKTALCPVSLTPAPLYRRCFSLFNSAAYFTPILGGIIADSFLGKFKVSVEARGAWRCSAALTLHCCRPF